MTTCSLVGQAKPMDHGRRSWCGTCSIGEVGLSEPFPVSAVVAITVARSTDCALVHGLAEIVVVDRFAEIVVVAASPRSLSSGSTSTSRSTMSPCDCWIELRDDGPENKPTIIIEAQRSEPSGAASLISSTR